MQLDVFTLVPHAFAWLTEQRPVASVLGTELDLRLFSYRDTTPLRAGQVDENDELVLRLYVAEADRGKVIGRQGRIARALRAIVRASAAREQRRVRLEIID